MPVTFCFHEPYRMFRNFSRTPVTQFIDRIGALNDRLISEGVIKPTQIVAVLCGRPTKPTGCYREWTPEFCVRRIE